MPSPTQLQLLGSFVGTPEQLRIHLPPATGVVVHTLKPEKRWS
ncbi:hypothetical protein [Hymenobacter fodinae]|nr:hypothetical protein [Hymenobacter fodinae]